MPKRYLNTFLKQSFRTKPIEDHNEEGPLKRCLKAPDLILLGIGAIIGAGIFVLTGVAAATAAGPALTISFAIAALACAFAAFAYAELASSIGGCGSAYGYAYAGFGELIAWIIGWCLLIEYGVSCSTISVGWSGYIANTLTAIGMPLPYSLLNGPFQHGFINLPAIFIIFCIGALLYMGVKKSAQFNAIIVYIKLTAIIVFIAIASFHFDIKNWHPFAPFGWMGVLRGAALIFFAYIGFDAVSTATEETIAPQKNLPKGIIGSLIICAFVFMIVTGLLTGAASYTTLNVNSPVSALLLRLGYRVGAMIVALGAVAGLTTVILVMYYGLTRIILAMARDGLLPSKLAYIHPQTHTPTYTIIITGLIMMLLGGFFPINSLAEIVNIGTLAAFTTVCAGVIVLRITKPKLKRPFKTPFNPLIPLLGVISCIILMINLAAVTWKIFCLWTSIGLVIYFCYSKKRSKLHIQNK